MNSVFSALKETLKIGRTAEFYGLKNFDATNLDNLLQEFLSLHLK